MIAEPIYQLLENDNKTNNHVSKYIEEIETSNIHASIFSSCNLVMFFNGLLRSNDGQAPLEKSRKVRIPHVGYQSGIENCRGYS